MSQLLSTTEVAALFQVTDETVRQWAKKGQIASVLTPSGRRKFRSEDVDEFLTSRGAA
jgi:excisionase family DNA binding protein